MFLSAFFKSRSKFLPHSQIPYSPEAIQQDLQRVISAWDECQSDRTRDAIYGYLNAVYELVSWWRAEGCDLERARVALRLSGWVASMCDEPFAGVILCTADPAKADKRTRSKWSRVIRYAADYKDIADPLDQFIKRKGGINACATRWSRCLGRPVAGKPQTRPDG